MFSRSAFTTVVLSIALTALADVLPTSPSPGQVSQQGSTCTIGWDADQTGTWKTLNIELMTGDNQNMVHLTTVATVDGTTSPGTFSYTCPAVTPPAAIYFYQFSSPISSNKTWTGRFTISDATGKTVSAPNANQPDGEPIAWGRGSLVDPSKAVPAPGGGNTTSTGTGSAVPLSSAVVLPSVVPSNAPASTPLVASASDSTTRTPSGAAAAATGTTGNTTTSSGSNSGGAFALGAVSGRAAQAGVALAVIAATFTFLV